MPALTHVAPSSKETQNPTYSCDPIEQRLPRYPADCLSCTVASRRRSSGLYPTHVIASYVVLPWMSAVAANGLFFRVPKWFGFASRRALKFNRSAATSTVVVSGMIVLVH